MSIAVAVAGPDGVALAADSRTVQRQGESKLHYRVSSDAGEKLFLLDGRLGVATYGIAMIGPRTIRGLIEDFPVPDGDVHECAQALGDFFLQELRESVPAPRKDLPKTIDLSWPLGFVVAGYCENQVGTLVDVKVRPTGSRCDEAEITTAAPGIIIRGKGDAARRMIDGVDWQAITESNIELDAATRNQLQELRYDLIDSITTEDAARRAQFFVEAQIAMQEFSDGTFAKPRVVPGCGGPVRVLTVDRSGAAWVRNPGRPIVSPSRDVAVLEHADEAG
jgi:hypothetical protein